MITGVETSITAFIGRAQRGPMNRPVTIASLGEFTRAFGTLDTRFPMTQAVRDFFEHGGKRAVIVRGRGDRTNAIEALERVDLFNLLCILPDRSGGNVPPAIWQAALRCCVRRRAMLLVDPPAEWKDPDTAVQDDVNLGLAGEDARNAALYFPRASDGRVPCGMVAGVFARVDETRGVWKAPAGIEATVNATVPPVTDRDLAALSAAGINALRPLPAGGTATWGTRTLRVREMPNDDYKYVPIRRYALFLEESIDRGLQWEVYEPSAVRLAVESFLNDLWRKGAMAGRKPEEAFFVQIDIDGGRVNITVGFAPLKPAEFVVIRICIRCL